MYNSCIVGINFNNNSLCNVKRYEYCKKMYFSIGVKWLRLFYDVVFNFLYDLIIYINCIDYSDGIVFF